MNATSKDALSKLVKAWESKNGQRAVRGAGFGLIAVSLAACGGGEDAADAIRDLDDPDGDGFANDIDAFPNDPTEWLDTDGDGIGDNADEMDDVPNGGDGAILLTADTDVYDGTAGNDVFFAGLVGGNIGERVNSLQSEDELNGLGGSDTLNVYLGQNNDNGGTEVAPVLTSIETVNVWFSSTAGNAEGSFTDQLNLEFSTGTRTVNVERLVGDNTDQYSVIGMESGTNTLSISGAPNDANFLFNYREGALESANDTLALDLSGVRLTNLDVTIGNRADAEVDEEMSFEQVNITTGGAYADVDSFDFQIDGDNSNWDALAQAVTLTLGVDTEFNSFSMPAADSLTIALGSNDLTITSDESDNDDGNTDANGAAVFGMDDADDGLAVGNLNRLTLTGSGDARLNGIDGEVQQTEFDLVASRESADSLAMRYTENNTGLAIDASGMTGRFIANISGAVASDDDSSLITGSGADYVDYMGDLNHTANTGAGNDYVEADSMLGLGRIVTGAGDDVVVTGDLNAFGDSLSDQENGGRDSAARIETGDGNDSVSVGDMGNAFQWDDNLLNDSNADDRYVTIGTSIDTGAGNDTVSVGSMAEQAFIETGLGNDVVSFDNALAEATLSADTDSAIEVVSVNESIANEATTEDLTGAVISTGAGDDEINWAEVNYAGEDLETTTIIEDGDDANGDSADDRGGAKIDAGVGADVLNVFALDQVVVAGRSSAADTEDLVLGVETLNLVAMNQIDATTAEDTGSTANDDEETNVSLIADIERFDTALGTINLVSEEDALLQTRVAGNELYEAGTATSFDLLNLRDQAVTLTAVEATGVTGNMQSGLIGPALVVGGGALVDDEVTDVNLYVTMAEGFDAFTLEMAGASDGVADQDFDLSYDDDDSVNAVTFNINDGASHAFDMNSYGETGSDVDSDRSLTITGSAAGETITVTKVRAEEITADIAADVNITVDAENHYTIVTGSGDDVIDMRASNVQSDQTATTSVDEADRINAGAGRDEMIIDESDNLGNDGNGTLQNDDDWRHLVSIEDLRVVVNDTEGEQQIVLDEDALETGVQTLTVVEEGVIDEYTLRLTFGDDFATAGFTGDLAGVSYNNEFITDLSAMDGLTTLRIDNKDDDTDLDIVNTRTAVNATGGVIVDAISLGADSSTNSWHITVANGANTSIASTDLTGGGVASGDVVLEVADVGHYDNLLLVDNADPVGEGESSITIQIDNEWIARDSTLTVDGSDIEDTDNDSSTGGALIFSVTGEQAGETARDLLGFDEFGNPIFETVAEAAGSAGQTLDITGTQNDDVIVAGDGADTIDGQDGNDWIQGDHVREDAVQVTTIQFADEYQEGDVLTFSIDGATFSLRVIGNDITGSAMALEVENLLDGDPTTDNPNLEFVGTPDFGTENVSASVSGSVLTITGNTAGERHNVSVTISNQPVLQSFTVNADATNGVGGAGSGLFSFNVVYDGQTYEVFGSVNGFDETIIDFGALAAAVEADGGSIRLINGDATIEITPAAGTPNNLITGYTLNGVSNASGGTTVAVASVDVVGGGIEADPVVTVTQLITDNTVYAADELTGGEGSDTFAIYKSGFISGGVHTAIDHITDMDFDSDVISFGAYWAAGTTFEGADRTVINSIVNQNAADGSTIEIALTGATLEQAVADLFETQGVFAAGDLNATNSAGLFTYGGRDYVIAVGDVEGGFGADDFIVEVTGYTGTMALRNGDIGPELVGLGSRLNTSPLTLERDMASNAFDDPFGFDDAGSGPDNGSDEGFINGDRVRGALEITYEAGDFLLAPNTFGATGNDRVDAQQMEVYLGTYVDGIFHITGNSANGADDGVWPGLGTATHTLIIFDNNDIDDDNDPPELDAVVLEGLFYEDGWDIGVAGDGPAPDGFQFLQWNDVAI